MDCVILRMTGQNDALNPANMVAKRLRKSSSGRETDAKIERKKAVYAYHNKTNEPYLLPDIQGGKQCRANTTSNKSVI